MLYSTNTVCFEHYFKPKELPEALSLLAEYGQDAMILAGGTDLIVLMRSRVLRPRCIIDVTQIPELDYVRYEESDGLRIGALATLGTVERSEVIREKYPLLYEAVQQMSTTQAKNTGTVVGNICRASPGADTIPPLLALEAEVNIASQSGTRIVPLSSFFVGPGETVLKNEMITEVRASALPPGTGTAFLRITRVAADLAKVNVAVVITMNNRVCQNVKIALGAVAPTPIRAKKAEAILTGKKLEDDLLEKAGKIASDESTPISDVRSSADYRRRMIGVLVARAIKQAVGQVKAG